MSRKRKAVAGVLTSYVHLLTVVFLQLLLAPVILSYAGKETLGAYGLIGQAIGYLALLDLGFSTTFNRYLARATGAGDDGATFRSVLRTGKTFIFRINLLTAAVCVGLAFGVERAFGFTGTVGREAFWSLLCMAAWSAVRTPLAIAAPVLIAQQELAFRNILAGVISVLRLGLSLAAVYAGYGLIGLTLASLVGEAVESLVCHWRMNRLLPGVARGWGITDKALFRDMLKFGKDAVFLNVSLRLVFFSDQLVVGFLYGAAATAIYYVNQMPATMGWVIVNRLADSSQPAIAQLYGMGNLARLREVFLSLSRYTLLLALALGIGLAALSKQFVGVWVGAQQYAGGYMNAMFAILTVLVTVSHLSGIFVLAGGPIRTFARLALIEGVLNVALSLLLGYYTGLGGVAAATVLCHLIAVVYGQTVVQRQLGINCGEYLRRVALPFALPVLAGGGAAAAGALYNGGATWGAFVTNGAAFAFVYFAAAWLTVLDPAERAAVLAKFKRKA